MGAQVPGRHSSSAAAVVRQPSRSCAIAPIPAKKAGPHRKNSMLPRLVAAESCPTASGGIPAAEVSASPKSGSTRTIMLRTA